MTTYYKATRPDGTSFYDGQTSYRVGRITRHPEPDPEAGLCSVGVLHISDAPAETLIGGRWPCRLFEVEPRSPLIGPVGHKYGCTAIKVQRELPAWQALGPNGEGVVAFLEDIPTLIRSAAWSAVGDAAWSAARDAARDAAWEAAWSAARNAAWSAARDAARDAVGKAAWSAVEDAAWSAAGDTILGILAQDLLTPAQCASLMKPWKLLTQ